MSDKHTLKTTIAASLLAGQTRSKKGHIPIFIVLVQFGDAKSVVVPRAVTTGKVHEIFIFHRSVM